jgi:hypothetical protein
MRFVGWRGLSEEYRRAVEGHSPWTHDVKDPEPICVENIEASDFPDPLSDGEGRGDWKNVVDADPVSA